MSSPSESDAATKHADRIRFVLMHQWADADKRMRALSSLRAVEAELVRLREQVNSGRTGRESAEGLPEGTLPRV